MTVEIVENGDGTKTIQVRGNTEQVFSIDGILATYTEIGIDFLKTVQPSAHVGFSEIMFGNMRKFNSSRQHNISTIHDQTDTTGIQTFPSRLDVTLNGLRDTDLNDFSRVSASIRCRNANGEPASFAIGTYYITSVRPVGTDKTQITAEDVRTILGRNSVYLTIGTSDLIGAKLIEMLRDVNIPSIIDPSLNVAPDYEIVYENETPIKILTDISSRFGIPITTGDNGEVILMQATPGTRDISASEIMQWPASEAVEMRTNLYDFQDGSTLDMRADPTIPIVRQSVDNRLLMQPSDKVGIVEAILESYGSNSVNVDTIGDPRIELGDLLNVETRDGWKVVKVTGIETRVGTSYRQKITGLVHTEAKK